MKALQAIIAGVALATLAVGINAAEKKPCQYPIAQH